MDFYQIADARYSCRNFSGKGVDSEVLNKILSAAAKSPSACNSQPWKFVVVNEEKLLPQMRECFNFNKFCRQVSTFVVMLNEGANLTEKLGTVLARKDFTAIDHGIAVQTLCLAAASEGVNSCIMGLFDQKGIKKLLGIPFSKKIMLIVALGYAAEPPKKRSSRKSLAQTVSYNAY